MPELSGMELIIYSLIPFGQVFARIFNFNGSHDFSFLLMIPPLHLPLFGLIPLLVMNYKSGFNKGNGIKTPLFDVYLMLPIIIKFYSTLYSSYFVDGSLSFEIITNTIQIIFGTIAQIGRRKTICPSTDLSSMAISKAIIDATTAHGIGEILVLIVKLAFKKHTPDSFGALHSIIWSLGYIATTLIINMFSEHDIDGFCSATVSSNQTAAVLCTIFTLIMLKFWNRHSINKFEEVISRLKGLSKDTIGEGLSGFSRKSDAFGEASVAASRLVSSGDWGSRAQSPF